MKIKSTFPLESDCPLRGHRRIAFFFLRFLDDFGRDNWIEIQREVLDIEQIDIAIG